MAKEPKFNFVEENLIENKSRGRECEYLVTLVRSVANPKKADGTTKPTVNYTIYFSKDVVNIYELAGKRVKFFVDVQKKAIGWKIIENWENVDTIKSEDFRIIKPNKPGSWLAGVGKLVNFAKFDIKESIHSLPVKKYIGPEYLQKEPIFYIELP